MLIEEAIYSLLTADALVVSHVSDRITPGFLDQSTTFPAIAYRLAGRPERVSTLGILDDNSPPTIIDRGYTGLAQSTFRFYCAAHGPDRYSESKQVANAVRLCLQGYRGNFDDGESPPTEVYIQSITPAGESDIYDDHTQTHQVIADYDVWHSEEQP